MKINEFLSTELMALPRERRDEDYEKFMSDWFDQYIAAVEGLAADDWPTEELKANRDVVAGLCRCICSALDQYFQGFPARAYKELAAALGIIDPWLGKLGTSSDVSSSLRYLYRIRLGGLADYRRSDLFHIPFERRHIVKPQRYSIPGLPSLYLGGSIWVCWEEMNRPAFERVQVSRFRANPNSKIRVLDLAYRPAVISRYACFMGPQMSERTDNAEFVLSHSICWPLLAACSVPVRDPGSPFVPEYVVPQLLLQWIRDKAQFEGVRYFSTRVAQHQNPEDAEQIEAAASAGANYVFPAVQKAATGHCENLSSQFELSAPMAWPIIQSIQMGPDDPESGPPRWLLAFNSDAQVMYLNTSFYDCERKINSLPCRSLGTAE